MSQQIIYSDKYFDKNYEYRHVILPKDFVHRLPNKLMSEAEWRALGVQQSLGWEHYAIHEPEPHILLFRRSLASPYATKPLPKSSENMTVVN
ncbi:Cyclin-dependent kinases regulatory subunit (Cell division control protein cks1) [Balamuthia mandrillaris]